MSRIDVPFLIVGAGPVGMIEASIRTDDGELDLGEQRNRVITEAR